MRLQFFKLEPFVHGDRIPDHVQVVILKIHNAITRFIFDEGIGNRPLVRYRPVKTLGSAWNGLYAKLGNFLLEDFQCFSYPWSGDTSRDGPEFRSQLMHEQAHVRPLKGRRIVTESHTTTLWPCPG